MESQSQNTETKELPTNSTNANNPTAKSVNTTAPGNYLKNAGYARLIKNFFLVDNVSNSGTNNAKPPQNANTPATTTTTSVPEPARNIESEEETIRNQKLVEEFQYLLEKSQNLFSGLRYGIRRELSCFDPYFFHRDLPPTGSHRQWRPVSLFTHGIRNIYISFCVVFRENV